MLQAGKPLGPATLNRYGNALGTIYKNLRRLRIVPRGLMLEVNPNTKLLNLNPIRGW